MLDDEEFLKDEDEYIDLSVGISQWQNSKGQYILEEDFKAGGDVWRVHKNDADPFPSNPHAHFIAGTKKFIGCTLHLGTGELFRKREPLGRKLEENQFMRLIALIQPKFPDIKLPLQQ